MARPFSREARYISAARKAQRLKRGLTASGARINQRDADVVRRLLQPWQQRAFTYYDLLGEIKNAAQFYSRALSVLRLYPAELDSNDEWIETEDEAARELLDRVQDPGGGRSTLLAAYGRLRFLTGEAYLLVTTDRDSGLEQWEMLSSDELRPTGSGYMRYRAPSLMVEDYQEPSEDDWEPMEEGTAIAYRLWNRHPRYSSWADSSMQGVLDLCEELVLLTQAVRSRARSRLAGSGILFIPEEISMPPLEPGLDEDPEEDEFIKDLTEAMVTPIKDEGVASAIVPHVVRAAAEYIEKVRHVQIIDPTQLYPETGLRMECIRRIAIGLDMPIEALLGMEDSNHWTAWQIDEQTWKAHLQPVAQQLVDDLTAAYYRPALAADGVADPERYAIRYDAAAVINHPDKTRDAKDLHEAGVIGDESLREAAGFDDDDAPNEEERNRWLGIRLRDSSIAITGKPAAPQVPPQLAQIDAPDDEGSGEASADVVKGPPPKQPAAEEEQPVTASLNGGSAHSARIIGACDLALARARELAGSRLRSHAKRDAECAKVIDGVRAGQVAHILGRERVMALNVKEQQLVMGVTDILCDALRLWNLDEALAPKLGEMIEQHAARTLFDDPQPPLPQSFTNYVLGRTVKP